MYLFGHNSEGFYYTDGIRCMERVYISVDDIMKGVYDVLDAGVLHDMQKEAGYVLQIVDNAGSYTELEDRRLYSDIFSQKVSEIINTSTNGYVMPCMFASDTFLCIEEDIETLDVRGLAKPMITIDVEGCDCSIKDILVSRGTELTINSFTSSVVCSMTQGVVDRCSKLMCTDSVIVSIEEINCSRFNYNAVYDNISIASVKVVADIFNINTIRWLHNNFGTRSVYLTYDRIDGIDEWLSRLIRESRSDSITECCEVHVYSSGFLTGQLKETGTYDSDGICLNGRYRKLFRWYVHLSERTGFIKTYRHNGRDLAVTFVRNERILYVKT